MGKLSKTALIAGVALILPAVAMAADVTPPTYQYPPQPVEYTSNIYLRLDGGFKWFRPPAATFDYAAGGFSVPGNGEFFGETISNTGLVGVGVGVQFSQYLRADITIDYEWPGNFQGYLDCPGVCGAPEYSTETADISALTILANGYFDLALSHGFTPYVGVGLGASRLTTTNVAYVNPDGTTGTWTGTSTWNFAWALTVGTAYQVTDRVSIDINYRYLHLGNAQALTDPAFGSTPINYTNINAHELRVGLRFGLW